MKRNDADRRQRARLFPGVKADGAKSSVRFGKLRYFPALLLLAALQLAAQPVITSGGIVGAGFSQPPVIKFSPLAIVSVFGKDFAPAGTASVVGSGDLVKGSLPTNLANVCVTFNGAPAPLFAVYPTQINLQVPAVSSASAGVQVTAGCGTAHAQSSNVVTVGIAAASPEFFYFAPGDSDSIAAVNQSGAYIGPSGLIPTATFVAANPGDIVLLFATGLGATKSGLAPGQLEGSADPIAGPSSLSIGGVAVQPSDLLYVGAAPGFAGLYQIDVRIGSYLQSGTQPVLLSVDGITAPLASLTIGAPASTCTLPNIDLLAAVTDQLTGPGPVTINFTTDGATSVSLTPLGSPNLPLSGTVSGTLSTSSRITLTAQNSCGSVTQSIPVAVGQPGVATVTNFGNPALGASAQPGQLIAVTPANLSHPELVDAVAFTNAAGLQVQDQILGIDNSGNLLVDAPFIADNSVSQGYDTGAITVSYILNGQAVQGIPMTVTPLSYQGDAVVDFASMADQIYNAAVQTNAAWANDPTFGPAAPGVLNIINTLYGGVKQMVAGLTNSASVQVPIDPYIGPSSGTVTVNVSDVATLMAFNANLLTAGQQISIGGSLAAATGTASARPHAEPRQSPSGCTPIGSIIPPGANPPLGACLTLVRVNYGLGPAWTNFKIYAKLIPLNAIAKGAAGAAVKDIATAALSLLALSAAADIFCDLSPVFLDPSMPFQVDTTAIPLAGPTPVTVTAHFTSKNENSEDLDVYLTDQFLDPILEYYEGELKGLPIDVVQAYFNEILKGLVSAARAQLNLSYPQTTKAALVGGCDIGFKPIPHTDGGTSFGKFLHVFDPIGTDWPLYGDMTGHQQMQVVPFDSHFLCLGVPTPWLCPPFNYLTSTVVTVGHPKGLSIQRAQSFVDNVDTDYAATCTNVTGPNGPVTPLSPYSLLLPDTDAITSQLVRQIDDSTWRITLTGANIALAHGCTQVDFVAGVTNLTNADNSQAMVVTINPDSTQPYQSDGNTLCDFSGITIQSPAGQMNFAGTGLAPQTVTVPMTASAGETTTEASIIANITGFASFVQACTLDFNVQLTGGSNTSARPASVPAAAPKPR
jgi:uncharacterized protein (TIGR03437 family)